MIDSFYEENSPPAWVLSMARARLRAEGVLEPQEWTLRARAWELVQQLERDAAARLG